MKAAVSAQPRGSAPPPTVLIQVPNAKSLIPGRRDQNQTATGCEAQIPHDILVARKIQKQEPWREQVSVRYRQAPRLVPTHQPTGSGWGLTTVKGTRPGPSTSQKDLPVCTSQILICPSLRPVARIRQETSGAWGWCLAQSFLLGGEGHGLKASPHTIWPQSSVFSFRLPRPFGSLLLLRLLASNPLGILGKADISD